MVYVVVLSARSVPRCVPRNLPKLKHQHHKGADKTTTYTIVIHNQHKSLRFNISIYQYDSTAAYINRIQQHTPLLFTTSINHYDSTSAYINTIQQQHTSIGFNSSIHHYNSPAVYTLVINQQHSAL